MAGRVPAIPTRGAQRSSNRDHRDKPGDDTRRCRARNGRRLPPPRTRLMNAALIFGLLVALMLTGMPISIALGLTVLTFLFTMTQVPIEAVGLKLFTGIENFEIMAVPFFILSGNFLTHGGGGKSMIPLAPPLIRHLCCGPG